ncbi:MAG: translocation/assembly module TamB domain-containing protein [Pseudomonadota bacterium]|nr:translocation/assembly module TamB domain-containing protein [Pseudomonadota bacterium]
MNDRTLAIPSDSPEPPAPGTPRSGWRWFRRLLWLLLALLLMLALALGAVLWWASSDGSLRQALHLAQKYLPEGQSLTYEEANGSITGGGTVQRLQWAMPGTDLAIEQLWIDWSLSELLGRALHVRALQAGRIHVRLSPQPDRPEPPGEPFAMPEQLILPIRVTLPVQVERLEIETVAEDGSSAVQAADDIAARYRYDGTWHDLQLTGLRHSQSHVRADVKLNAHDLGVRAKIGAWLSDPVPDVPLRLQALLQADGTLAGGDAAHVDLRLDAQEHGADADAAAVIARLLQDVTAGDTQAADGRPPAAMLHGLATLHPWRGQPVQQAHVRLGHLNARAFHAAAPVTDLDGHIDIDPDDAQGEQASLTSAAWKLAAEIRNRAPGAWDAQRLPVDSIEARARYAPERIDVEQARVMLQGARPAGRIELQGWVHPQQPDTADLQLGLHELNLQPLLASLPETAITGTASVHPLDAGAEPSGDLTQARWQIEADIRNAAAGLIDKQRLPLSQLLARARITPERWTAETVQVHVGDGRLQLQGHFEPQTQALDVRGELRQLPLVQIHGELAAQRVPDLSGTLAASGQLDSGVGFDVDITGQGTVTGAGGSQRSRLDVRAIQARGHWSPQRLDLEHMHLDAFQARVDARKLNVALPDAERIEAVVKATAPGLDLDADVAMRQASGGGKLTLNVASAEQLLGWLRSLPVLGEALPALKATGGAQIAADWQGGWQQWLDGLQDPAAHPDLRLDAHARSAGLHVELPAAEPARAAGAEGGKASSATVIDMKKLDAQVRGNLAAATLVAQGELTANGTHAVLATRAQTAQTGTSGAPVWNITLQQLAAAATLPGQKQPWRLELGEGLQVTAQTDPALRITTTAGQATLAPPAGVARPGEALVLRWEPVHFSQAADGATRIQSRGQLGGLVPAWVDALMPDNPPLEAAGIRSSLVLSGDWDVDMSEALRVQASIRRDNGDLWLGEPSAQAAGAATSDNTRIEVNDGTPARGVAAGIRKLELLVQSDGDEVQARLDWDTERAGIIQGQAQTRLARQAGGWTLPDDAPLGGQLRAQLQDLGVWGSLAPLGWRITGALDADVKLAGTVQAPQLQGPIRVDGLNLRSVLDGVDLHDGRLRARLDGHRLDIEELVLQGGTGSHAYVRGMSGNRTPAPAERGRMAASGHVDWSGVAHATAQDSGIALDVNARLEGMQVLVRSDRQVSVSGELSAGLADGRLRVRGDLHVDRASITLPESGAPTLGKDVVVVRASERQAEAEQDEAQPRGELRAAKPMDMEVKLDLGRDFALQGYGITTRLEGDLTIRSAESGNDPVGIVGEIRTDEGRFRAWGQALNVETGVVLFNGPYSNPSLNLLALRPNIDVRAGVRVTGTALAPRVALYSEPPLPDAETLSWVVLGRAPGAGGGDGNAMQQAALGLVAGNVGESLGFDEVGLSESGVSIGKRLSDQLYVTYEAGMAGAASTLYMFYDITRRLTARGQTGKTSAVDLIYTITYD